MNIYEQAVGASNVYGGRQGQKLLVTWVAKGKNICFLSNILNKYLMKLETFPGSTNVHARGQGWGREVDERGVVECPQLKRGAHNKVRKSERVSE